MLLPRDIQYFWNKKTLTKIIALILYYCNVYLVYIFLNINCDLDSLKSREDIKCDGCGSWRCNSNTKYQFTKKDNAWFRMEKDKSQKEGKNLTLKRDYFMLRGDTDFRKRIDTIIRMLTYNCEYNYIHNTTMNSEYFPDTVDILCMYYSLALLF